MYDRMKTKEPLEVLLQLEREPPNLNKIQAVYRDLMYGKIHRPICLCPSCLYHFHKRQGGRYSKEIFFLEWLLFEINLSLRNRMPQYIFDGEHPKGILKSLIEGRDLRAFFQGRGSLKTLSKFLEKHFPKLDHDYGQLKLRLWRFKKSGTLKRLEKAMFLKWTKTHPRKKSRPSREIKLLQKIADFIYSSPGRRVSQRDIQRRFFQRETAANIENVLYDLRPWLELNYGIKYLEGKKDGLRKYQAAYIGTLKTSRGRIWRYDV